MASERVPMSPVDAAWWRMDSPTNLMMITGVLTLDRALSMAELGALIEQRLLPHARFTQRVVEPRAPVGVPHWEVDARFDAHAHLHRVALPAPGGQRELEELVSDLASTPLDRDRPLWQIHLVEGVGDGAALVVRLHHCIGDGVALVGVLLDVAEEASGPSPQAVGLVPARPRRIVDRARQIGAQASALGRMLMLPADPPSLLKGALGRQKRVAWSEPVPLASVKRVAARVEGKANDVLMGAVAGALRRYLDDAHGYSPGLELRAMVPVFLQGEHADGGLGNHFGLVYVPLPLAGESAVERVRAMKREMDVIKAAPDAIVAFEVLAAMGVAAPEMERIGIDLFTRKASVMVTNIPGPPAVVHLSGRAVSDMMVWAPVSGHIAVGISLLSYGGAVRLGVATDASLVPRPARIVDAFHADLAELGVES